MSKKYKHFLNLSTRQKKRRLDARKDHSNVCKFANDESDGTSSENEPVQISASHLTPSISTGDAFRNEESTDVHRNTSDGNKEIDDSKE